MSLSQEQRLGRRPRQGPGADQSRPAVRNDDGQLMVLIIGYVLLALLLATVVTAASSVYIEHKKLLSLADGASVAAADSFTLGQLETASGSPTAVLTGARVRGAAVDFLDRSSAFTRFSSLSIGPGTGSPDGSTAVVVLSAAVHPPVVNFLVPDGIRIEASSTARSRLTR
ncbi:pilus assembly protein TadG-related protein [uncultured Arthrobacter sp.]|uniref:pilus assembly protein TadG-related protein n=1 Tax=uncultured Arthrobacter sp. TaxID=114050 RepID=UPI0032166A5D